MFKLIFVGVVVAAVATAYHYYPKQTEKTAHLAYDKAKRAGVELSK